MEGFRFNEKYLSQIPALQMLINLGYEYLSPEKALVERQGKTGNVILENILQEQLKKINQIQYKGRSYLFSEENIQSAVQKLKNIKYDGLQKTNEAVYDLLTLGTALEQSIEGSSKSFNLRYIDWKNLENNAFHVSAEFSVAHTRSNETNRPDIVLFVNGVPLAVIECKAPDVEIEQAISQSIRNQRDEFIPKLFTYAQLVMGINKNAATYATAGTPARFWSIWHEKFDADADIEQKVNTPLSTEKMNSLFKGDFAVAGTFFDALEGEGHRQLTEQDRALYSLCRPERLLELTYKFTVFDAGLKKIARYQQYVAVRRTLAHVKKEDGQGRRKSGMIWHTQGSGKSITMVMLVRNLVLDSEISDPRVVLVTDRVDLDKQLGNTFAACGLDPQRASTGKDLLDLVAVKRAGIVTTLIHKFEKALKAKKHQDDSSNIFMLVDEGHRTQFGTFAVSMRLMFPNACYLGFTGTPLKKKEKNNFVKFGSLIDDYPIDRAVKDKAIVPLLYEGRHVEIEQNKKAIDLWFERHTQGLTKEQKADLKRKYSRAEMLSKTEQVVYMRAFDISEHFRQNWQNTGFKAQLVAPGKFVALKYQECLDELGHVSSEVVISGPDSREGYEDVDDEPKDTVKKFWDKMMKRYGSEEEYNKQIINQFKFGDTPEILIVVDKLLTGFDAPRNTVLYLTRTLREHTLLQAVARVNRLFSDEETGAEKEFGYIIDYASVLGELDKALSMYSAFEEFDEDELAGALQSVRTEVEKLPQKHSDLWDLFKEVKNQHDEEAYEALLADQERRDNFYECLKEYGQTLGIALSSEQFIMQTEENKLDQYKNDLKQFQKLKNAVKMRYAEIIDYRDYEPKIRKLLDTHLSASEVYQLNEPVNIFDEKNFTRVKEEQAVYGSNTTASKADTIAHATKKVITENMGQDPAFYEPLSKLIQQTIDDFRAKRITDLEYLEIVTDARHKTVTRQHEDEPQKLVGNDDALALYGIVKPHLESKPLDDEVCKDISTETALAIYSIFTKHRKVHFWDDEDAKKRVENDIDDYLYDEIKENKGVQLSLEDMDSIIREAMVLLKNRTSL